MHVGDVLVDLMTQLKVDTIFGVPGGQTLPLYDGIANAGKSVKSISMREERSAAYAAVAYARLTNKVGVCDATVGPGATQFTSGLAEAFNSSTPIFSLFSDLPTEWEHLRDRGNASQGIYQLDMVKPFTKWTGRITSQKAMPDMIRNAFLKAVSGRPGPTALSIHEDVFKEQWEGERPLISSEFGKFPRFRSVAEDSQIEKALSILIDARKPVLVVGGGAMLSQAENEITNLAETFNIPILQTFTGRGVVADDHPLGIGMYGGIGTLSAKQLAEDADVVFLIGFKSSQNSTFTWTIPSVNQRVIHLDIDEVEIGRVFNTEVGLVGDAKATISRMIELAHGKVDKNKFNYRTNWIEKAKEEWNKFVLEEVSSQVEIMKPQQVIDTLNQFTNEKDVLVTDASFSSGWGALYFKQKTMGRRLITPRGIAGLGFGLPAAIGASIAVDQGDVYLIAGDGGIGYSLNELATLQAYNLKVTIIVLDNRNWGWMEWLNKLNYDKEYFDLPAIQFSKIAEGFGLNGFRVKNQKELMESLSEAKKSLKSSLIHIDTALWETPVIAFREAIKSKNKVPVKYL